MKTALLIWFGACSVLAAVPTVLLMWRYDRFVRTAYREDREFWRLIGEPRGFFWIPREKLASIFAFAGWNRIPRAKEEAKRFFGERSQLWRLYEDVLAVRWRAFVYGAVGAGLILGTMAYLHFGAPIWWATP